MNEIRRSMTGMFGLGGNSIQRLDTDIRTWILGPILERISVVLDMGRPVIVTEWLLGTIP